MDTAQKTKVAVIGLGNRGYGELSLLLLMDDVDIVGVCDLYEDRAEAGRALVEQQRGYSPFCTTDYRRVLEIPGLKAIVTPSSWRSHIGICIDAMNAGIYAATEVGGAYSLDSCWELVKTYERTGIPCMLLENCCYGREEMTVLNMVKNELFGELVHASGAYQHDLRYEVTHGQENRHYRLRNFSNRNAELYPTHELGPISKWLDINRGNRMLSLVSIASKSTGIQSYVKEKLPAEHPVQGKKFTQGDIVTTIIKCSRGETIMLEHGTSLPRPYSRANRLQGTKGIYMEDKNYGIFIDGMSPKEEVWEHLTDYYDRYEHPLWMQYRVDGVKAGHGGMDYLVLRAFIEAVQSGTDTPIDTYDTASWMAVSILSENSIAMGGHPVAVPDFTNGLWMERAPAVRSKYCLNEVCEEYFEFLKKN
ncbi:MAG: gfo/Idh/MocA family oxidoreductase [Oscillospiraceae bacterium]|nr:gfo/Idh/MocA family oxidoreductase [Oscillospiraceae bacterium]